MIEDAFKEKLTELFKPVKDVRFEYDHFCEPIDVGERDHYSYPPIMGNKTVYLEKNRYPLICFIRFLDGTGAKVRIEPQKYLGELKEKNNGVNVGFGCTAVDHSTYRQIDYNKCLKTIIISLNPSLQGEK